MVAKKGLKHKREQGRGGRAEANMQNLHKQYTHAYDIKVKGNI